MSRTYVAFVALEDQVDAVVENDGEAIRIILLATLSGQGSDQYEARCALRDRLRHLAELVDQIPIAVRG